jgi:hypothetical protein
MHVYLGFVSQERDKCSNSVYLGMVTLKWGQVEGRRSEVWWISDKGISDKF